MASKKKIFANSKGSLQKQVEALRRSKLAASKVVPIDEFIEWRKRGKVTVLVVDDDEMTRNALGRILGSQGYTVIMAEDGLGLSKALETQSFDLVLLDVNLPWVDGFELCELIKGHPSFKSLPLILMSGQKTEDDLKRGFGCGCDEYLAKPIHVEHLLRLLENYVGSILRSRQGGF